VSSAINDLHKAGTIRQQDSRPFITCPLGVLDLKSEIKLQFIWDGREVNIFLYAAEICYESLRQVPRLLRPDVHTTMFRLDFK